MNSKVEKLIDLFHNQKSKMEENKRNRTCHKYHYETVKICVETDVICTRCRICWEIKPSTIDYFRKDPTPNAQRLIQPLCNECAREMEKKVRAREREKSLIRELETIKHVEEQPLIEESVESKIDRILSFLWLNKWTSKK